MPEFNPAGIQARRTIFGVHPRKVTGFGSILVVRLRNRVKTRRKRLSEAPMRRNNGSCAPQIVTYGKMIPTSSHKR
jgi:hypothetical protein